MTATNANILQPTGFKITIDRENYPNLEYFIQNVQHPSVSMVAPNLSYSRISSVAISGEKLDFGEVTFMIMLDENMVSYQEMFDWMCRLVVTKHIPASERTSIIIPDAADITLSILTSNNTSNKKIIYKDAVPVLLGDIAFDATIGDIQPIVVPVSFKYTYFELL